MGMESNRMLSHYRLVEKVGEGGMGVVWKAEDTVLNRNVAIKVLPADLALDEERRKMFLDEARLAASVSHGNIVQVYELGREGDLDFIVMEYVEGKPLSKILHGRPLPPDKVADWGLQVAEGLARAHRKGLIHRDIKPANLLVTCEGEVKIVDFGLATLFSRSDDTATATRTLAELASGETRKEIVGTLPYMSPEQVRGEKLDARSDTFSVGSVLYEMTTGRRPFIGTAARDVAEGILRSQPTPIREFVHDVPVDLHRIIEKSMARRPADRYQHTDDLAVDLKRLARDLDSGSSSWHKELRRFGGRRRWLPALVATMAALAVVVVGYIKWPRPKPEPPSDGAAQSVAVVDFRNLADPEDETSGAVLTSLVELGLIESSPCRVVALDYLRDLRRRRFGSTPGPIRQEQALDVAREAGATTLILGDIAQRGEELLVVWRLVDTHGGNALGAQRAQGNDFAVLADSTVAGVVSLLARICAVESRSAPRSVAAMTTSSQGAYRHYVAALAAEERGRWGVQRRELEQAVLLDSTFALAYFELGNLDRAWELRSTLSVKDRLRLEAAREERLIDKVTIYREIQSRWPDDRRGLTDFGRALHNAWSFDEAAAILERATNLYPDDANLTTAYWMSLHWLHRHNEAIASVRRYLQRNPGNANMWDSIGLSFLALGLPDSAETHFLQALGIDPELYSSQRGLAWCAYARGDLARAIQIDTENSARPNLTEWERSNTKRFTMHNPGIANYYWEAGQFDKAVEIHDQSRSEAPSHLDFEISVNLARRGRLERAVRTERYLSTRGSRVHLLASLLHYAVLVAQDSLDEARAMVDRWPALTPAYGGVVDYGIKYVRAEDALREGNPEQALALLTTIKSKGNPWGANDIQYRELLAEAYRMADQHDNAVAVLQELLRVYPAHALAHYELGKDYDDMGHRGEAEEAYNAFLEAWEDADEDLPELRAARERMKALQRHP